MPRTTQDRKFKPTVQVNCESKLGLAQRPYLGDAHIAYRILLTIPVIVASAERSFSKLKLIKSYLRSTMSPERLSELAILLIENKMLEELEYKNLINQLTSQKTKIIDFKWNIL